MNYTTNTISEGWAIYLAAERAYFQLENRLLSNDLQAAQVLSTLSYEKSQLKNNLTAAIELSAYSECQCGNVLRIQEKLEAALVDLGRTVALLREVIRAAHQKPRELSIMKPKEPSIMKLDYINGRWVTTFCNAPLEGGRQATVLSRLKSIYEQQCRNIILLEKERNALHCEVQTLRERSPEQPKRRK